MVQHCFNPACHQEFRLLHAGDLYALERQSADTEFFWLCSDCASRFDLYLEASGVVVLGVQGSVRPPRRSSVEGELHLISRCARPAPRPDSRPTAERYHSFAHRAEPHFSGYRTRAWFATGDDDDVPEQSAPNAA